MGLRRDKVQSTSMGFFILPRADDKEATSYKICVKGEKYMSKEHIAPRHGLRGLKA
jgi:hypothetical protein